MLSKEARQRDPVLRAAWFKKLADWRADQLVFLDESGINTTLGEPTHGYAKKGSRIEYKVKAGRAENMSLLPAITVDGYLVCNAYQGAVNMEMFIAFVRDFVLPKCNPWPQPRSVIIMDNAKIHRSEVSTKVAQSCN